MKHILGIYVSGKLWQKIHLDDYPAFLRGETISLGRRETCDICIPQATVSREHAHIRFDGKKVRIIDNGSLNGISVGGKQKSEIVLENGMQVRIGSGATDSVVIMYVEVAANDEEPISRAAAAPEKEKVPEKQKVERPAKTAKRDLDKSALVPVGRRLFAAMADWTVVMFMCAGFAGILVLTLGLGGIVKLVLVFGLIATIGLYFALSESGSSGATFGKHLFSLKVVDKNGNNLTFQKAALRLVAKAASAFTFFLPVFGKGRCLHDVIAGTNVVETNKRTKTIETEQV